MKNNMCNSVVMLSRSHLHPHPDNPRKDLGDLEELRESIREHGIMQNLTVIPVDDEFEDFTILIGHRRFAASEGILTELPCVIVEDLSDREQIGIMLCENLQRNDLTFIEQAHGFQMMMDLGDTVESISEKTGFSERTVKHRLEIAKLDKKVIDKVQKETSWQIGINDYIELEKIKDLKDRAEVLEDSSSSDDLEYNINRYLRIKKTENNKEKLMQTLDSIGCKKVETNISYNDKYKLIHFLKRDWISLEDDIDFDELKDVIEKRKGKKEVVYQISYSVAYVATVVSKPKEKKKTAQELERDRLKENEKALTDARKQICAEFAKCIMEIDYDRLRHLEKEKGGLVQMFSRLWDVAEAINLSLYSYSGQSDVLDKESLKPLIESYEDFHLIQKITTKILIQMESRYSVRFCDYWNHPNKKVLEAFYKYYDVLFYFGCRLSNEFELIIEGSSDLYEPEDEEEA